MVLLAGTCRYMLRLPITADKAVCANLHVQVAAAISPLHSSLAAVQQRLEELADAKQDRDKALTLDDVNMGVARAIDHGAPPAP